MVVSEITAAAQVDDLEVRNELWERIRPLLPVVQRRYRWPGRKRMDDRACLNGIVFALATGIGWSGCRSSWATARGCPAGAGYGTGRPLACGTGCTRYSVDQ